MVDNTKRSTAEEIENPQEQETESLPTTDIDTLTRMQLDAIPLLFALPGGVFIWSSNVKNAEKIFREKIDVNKLIKDKKYRNEVVRHIEWAKSSRKLKEEDIKKIEHAVSTSDQIRNTQVQEKAKYSDRYTPELKQIYGLTEEQLKEVKTKALKRLKEDPSLSMSDALKIEAGKNVSNRIDIDVKNDKSIKRVNRNQERQKRLTEIEKKFNESAQTRLNKHGEEVVNQNIVNNGRKKILQDAGEYFETKPIIPPSPQESPSQSQGPPPNQNTPPLIKPQSGGWRGVKNIFSGLKNGIGSAIKNAASTFTRGIKDVLSLIKAGLGLAKNLIAGISTGGVAFLADLGIKFAKWLVNNLKPLLKNLLGNLGERVSELIDTILSPERIFKTSLKIVFVIVAVFVFLLLSGGGLSDLAAPGTSSFPLEQ